MVPHSVSVPSSLHQVSQFHYTYKFVDFLTKLAMNLHRVNIDSNEGFLKTGKWPLLTVMSAGHALHIFVNGQLSGDHRSHIIILIIALSYIRLLNINTDEMTGTVYGSLEKPELTFSGRVNLQAGINKISLLSVAVGLPVSL